MKLIELLTSLGTVTAALFIVLDPLAVMPLVYSITAGMDRKGRNRLIIRVVGVATLLLLFFTITGTWVLRLFGVTLNDLRIGGGLLLLVTSLRLVVQGEIGNEEHNEYRMPEAPLISPLLIGPGAITAAVVLATSHGILLTSLAGVIAMFASLLVFLAAPLLHRLIGDAGTDLLSRIVGVLIAAIGVSYMRTGIMDLVRKWP
ncbi:MAG: MarC family protein [Armatimonadetes bacterium]|nr:MarC family protein [Armatimonadota bacterium]